MMLYSKLDTRPALEGLLRAQSTLGFGVSPLGDVTTLEVGEVAIQDSFADCP